MPQCFTPSRMISWAVRTATPAASTADITGRPAERIPGMAPAVKGAICIPAYLNMIVDNFKLLSWFDMRD